jgi:transglutaminase/protease-like cytokinesis protein 3
MRKWMLMLTAALVLLVSLNVQAGDAEAAGEWLNQTKVSSGVLSVDYALKAGVKTKLMIAKNGVQYTYNLTADRSGDQFPLQLGNGEYNVSLLENAGGNKYKVVKKETVKLQLKDEKAVFLNSVQNVTWTSSDNAIKKAKELTANKKTDTEKAKAIYDYIISNIQYDTQLAAKASTDYLPDIDRTLKLKKDICYGYASLYAAMLRSVDIPTKLLMGNTTYVDVYHAWNEVYLDGKWVTIDTTVDAGLKKANKKYEFTKDAAKYKANKLY